MTLDADDRHCDSLTGAALGAEALTIPPSLPPAAPELRYPRWLGLCLGGLALAAALGAAVRHPPVPPSKPAESDALRVSGHTVSYSARYAARAGIRTVVVEETAFSPVISGAGKTRFDPAQVAAISASALGTLRRVAKYEGDSVKRGEVLAEIGSPLSARLEAGAGRVPSAPRAALGVSVLRSPLAGTVIESHVMLGQSVRGERVAFVVANLDRLLVDVPVDRGQARTLAVGDRVELARDASPAAPISGSVAALDATDLAGSALLVRVAVDNRSRSLRLGQALSARIYASNGGRALVIPQRALAWIGGRPAVFLSTGQNTVSAAAVTLGGSNADQTEVQVGLARGQRIVSDGVRTLKDESFL